MIFIIGIGYHSEVVYSIFISNNEKNIKFLSYPYEININELSETIKNNYAGGLDEIIEKNHDDHQFIIGIGDNKKRKDIVEEFKNLNYINAIHPSATIFGNVKLGKGNVVCAGAVIQIGTTIGDHNIINTNASVDHHNKVGNYCHVAPNCALCGNVTLHDGVFIGVGSSVVPKVTIKPWAFIKANSLVKKSSAPIQMYEPYISKYKTSAIDAISSGWISSLGKYVSLATEKLKTILNIKYVILTNNGTAATHCLFLALKSKYPNINKIYVPNNVYVAAWNCALMEYDEKQLEVMKLDEDTWNISIEESYIKSLDKDSAILIVHNVGNVVNIPKLKKLRPDLIFIEDNCEGLFAKYEEYFTGASDATLCTSLSFFGNKTITTGEGGALLTNDEELYEYLHKCCYQGMSRKRYVHEILAYNYRITNIQAGFLYDQLCDYDHIIKLKKKLFDNYEKLLEDLTVAGKVKLQQIERGTERANWMFTLRIINNPSYEKIQQFMIARGIDVRPMFYPIESHKHLENIRRCDDNLPILLNKECLMIPSYPTLTFNEQEYIIDCLAKYIDNL